jgi:hypothetical protein
MFLSIHLSLFLNDYFRFLYIMKYINLGFIYADINDSLLMLEPCPIS